MSSSAKPGACSRMPKIELASAGVPVVRAPARVCGLAHFAPLVDGVLLGKPWRGLRTKKLGRENRSCFTRCCLCTEEDFELVSLVCKTLFVLVRADGTFGWVVSVVCSSAARRAKSPDKNKLPKNSNLEKLVTFGSQFLHLSHGFLQLNYSVYNSILRVYN